MPKKEYICDDIDIEKLNLYKEEMDRDNGSDGSLLELRLLPIFTEAIDFVNGYNPLNGKETITNAIKLVIHYDFMRMRTFEIYHHYCLLIKKSSYKEILSFAANGFLSFEEIAMEDAINNICASCSK